MFKIGNVEIKGQIICAPMAGITNKAFRKLVRDNGAALTYTEMTSNVGLQYNLERTLQHANIGPEETPVAIQIFGGEVDDYVKAAKYFDQNSDASIIDINMGCPVTKVAIKSNAGSALIKTPEKIRQIIRQVVSAISKPLTIKIRIGWDENDLTYLEVAKIAEEEGAAAIAVHGRTRKQMYTGKANWDAIQEIKDSVSIPVIGNGDVTTPEEAKKMIEYTGVDAVMVARAVKNNPFILKQMQDYLDHGHYENNISLAKICDELTKFYYELKKIKGESIAQKEIKGAAANWLSGFANIKKEKDLIIRSETMDKFFMQLEELKNKSA